MDWQGLLFIDISVCVVIYIIVILPLFIISWIFGKSICFWKVFRLSTIQRLLEASDYQRLSRKPSKLPATIATMPGKPEAGASLVGLVGAAGWVLSFRGSKAGGWPHGSGPGGGFRPSHFSLLMAAVGGTMPEMPAKAAERRYTAFLWRGYVRYRVNIKAAHIACKWP